MRLVVVMLMAALIALPAIAQEPEYGTVGWMKLAIKQSPDRSESYIFGWRDYWFDEIGVQSWRSGHYDDMAEAYEGCYERQVWDSRVIITKIMVSKDDSVKMGTFWRNYVRQECPALASVLLRDPR
ncbi:MAG: hypothetical protein AAGA44_10140 [Pseudomonadota bacterium]